MSDRAPAPGQPPTPDQDLPARRLSGGERRQQLFSVALRLFSERGYRTTTMDDIAEAAGVTKPLVYQHFSSKRALYLELVDSVAQELVTAIGRATTAASGPRQQVEMGLAAYFDLVVAREEDFRLLYGRNDDADEELGQALRRVEDTIAEAIEPLIAAGLDAEHRRFLAYGVVGMAEGASRHWLASRATNGSARPARYQNDGAPTAEAKQLASRLADLAWAGLRSVHPD
jgi:AcrR family transcriptional regulator